MQARTGQEAQQARELAQSRLVHFRDALDQALFLDTRFTASTRPTGPEVSLPSDPLALEVFGAWPSKDWAPNPALTAEERTKVEPGMLSVGAHVGQRG